MVTKTHAALEDLYKVAGKGMGQSNRDMGCEGRRWTREEFDRRMYQTPEKIELAGGIFASERERLTVLAMLLENLGIDQVVRFGKLADWKAAIADLERQQSATSNSSHGGHEPTRAFPHLTAFTAPLHWNQLNNNAVLHMGALRTDSYGGL